MRSMENFGSPTVRPFGGPRWAEAAALLAELVTIDDAKRIYKGRVPARSFDQWVARGSLPQATGPDGRPVHDVRGRPLYRLATIDLQASAAAS